ncbi:MAG: sel1 repeat family protein [Candidatus Hydrogenedentes bacterium]|nr:sel1 repeat family protein [Candidatus Hydrogenedentota bacterium]
MNSVGPISYTNRKGKTYYLHAVTRKSGKTSYAMKLSEEGALTELPEGYSISESVNGQVSVGRAEPRTITEREEAEVTAILDGLGQRHHRCAGTGVGQKDMTEAVVWFRKAAELAEPVGQFRLGVCYASGEGVERDEREAAIWFQRAADAGLAPAQFKTAVQFISGSGVPKDPARGVQYLIRAADQGYVRAQTKLGECYCTGHGVAKNWDAAATWLGRAAKAGDANAERLLRRYGVRH